MASTTNSNKKRSYYPIIIGALFITGLILGNFVSSSAYSQTLKTSNDQLKTKQEQLAELEITLSNLENDYAELTTLYNKLQQNDNTLKATYNSLNSQYNTLVNNHTQLTNDYNSLLTKYNTTKTEMETLKTILDRDSSEFNAMFDEYLAQKTEIEILRDRINDSYSQYSATEKNLLNYLNTLSNNVSNLNHILNEYTGFEAAFQRVLNYEEIQKIGPNLRSIIGSSTDDWTNYEKIYRYITTNVDYVNDIEFPYIGYWNWAWINGVKYYTSFEIDYNRNYLQTPKFTLQYKQGDCDDQAVLEYALHRYYNKYVDGTDYSLYLAHIEYSNGESHIAVFMPVQGGKLTILDPAGNYITSTNNRITSNTASSELAKYNTYWSSNGQITNIKLYWVDILDGSYNVVANGDLNTINNYLTNR